MNEAEWRDNDDPKLRELLGYALRTSVSYQDGRHSEAPALLFADYDFEVDDGACGVAADGKRCNEPAIVYARADALMDAIARAELAEADRDAAMAEVQRLRENLRNMSNAEPCQFGCGVPKFARNVLLNTPPASRDRGKASKPKDGAQRR